MRRHQRRRVYSAVNVVGEGTSQILRPRHHHRSFRRRRPRRGAESAAAGAGAARKNEVEERERLLEEGFRRVPHSPHGWPRW